MHDELTAVDIQKMKEGLGYRSQVLRRKIIEDVQTARAFGDLSEILSIRRPNRKSAAMTAVSAIWSG